jgi:hypothetical protein
MGTARMIRTVKGRPDASATWRPDIPRRGRYAVYVSYKSLGNSVTDAQYTIRHLGGETVRTVNQRIGGGTWIFLGFFKFDKGRDGCVILNDKSEQEGVVTADGVRFGGGIGRVRRAGTLSGLPAYAEGAYYNMVWSGVDSTAFTDWDNDYTRDFAAPITAGEKMGTITWLFEDGTIGTYDLVATRTVNRRSNAPKTLAQIEQETASDPNPFPRWSLPVLFEVALPLLIAALILYAIVRWAFGRRKPRRSRDPQVTHRYLR